MAQILVRNLDEGLVTRLQERARQNHRSLQGEVRAILEEEAPMATRAEALAIADKWQRYWRREAGPSAIARRSSAGCAMDNADRLVRIKDAT
jgi:plasmid stability protein